MFNHKININIFVWNQVEIPKVAAQPVFQEQSTSKMLARGSMTDESIRALGQAPMVLARALADSCRDSNEVSHLHG